MKEYFPEDEYTLTAAGEAAADLQAAVDAVWDIVRRGAYEGCDYSRQMSAIRMIVEPYWSGNRRRITKGARA